MIKNYTIRYIMRSLLEDLEKHDNMKCQYCPWGNKVFQNTPLRQKWIGCYCSSVAFSGEGLPRHDKTQCLRLATQILAEKILNEEKEILTRRKQ